MRKVKITKGMTPSIQKLIEIALAEIADQAETVYITGKRARGKIARLPPTDNQAHLLRWIKQHQPISFAQTLGMDWRFLGGLFTRSKVYWASDGTLNVKEE